MESRRFKRYRFEAPCDIEYDSTHWGGNTHDISSNGAMIRFAESTMIPEGERCRLRIEPAGIPPLVIEAEVVYSSFFSMGVKFVAMDHASSASLTELLEKLDADSTDSSR